MDRSLVEQVWARAQRTCEYCGMPQEYDALPFEIEHIIAKQHRGKTVLANLALACFADNHHKGPNLAGIDPQTRKLTPLFHPRRNKWERHFRWDGPFLVGRTAVGRVTVAVLAMNAAHRVALRASLIEEGVFPPR
jgi:hypothetical protein